MTDQAALVSQFKDISGSSDEEAKHFLEAFAWNYEEAVKAYFESEGKVNAEVHADGQRINVNSNPIFTGADARASSTAGSTKLSVPVKESKKVVTLDALRNERHLGADNSGEEGQAFYVGGSETGGGGQQVLGPPRRDRKDRGLDPSTSADSFVHNLFEAAKGRGAEVLDKIRSDDTAAKSKGPIAFSGTAYKLGEDSAAPSVVETPGGPSSIAQNDSQPDNNVVVKMWRNGFSLDDGPVRAYTDPDSRAFLEEIEAGRVPQELVRAAHGGLVNLMLEDHHHEDWSAPPMPKHKPFSGAGKMLGHPTPRLAGVRTEADASTPTEPSSTCDSAVAPQIDAGQPTTQLQVRLPDGGRLIVHLNQTHTVADLRQSIICQRPNLATTPFILLTSFPTRELSRPDQTLKEANLLNTAVLVRLA